MNNTLKAFLLGLLWGSLYIWRFVDWRNTFDIWLPISMSIIFLLLITWGIIRL